jgi:hypothetical protein
MYEDEDNDGSYPDESPVEVRYPRSKQEEQSDRIETRDDRAHRERDSPCW